MRLTESFRNNVLGSTLGILVQELATMARLLHEGEHATRNTMF